MKKIVALLAGLLFLSGLLASTVASADITFPSALDQRNIVGTWEGSAEGSHMVSILKVSSPKDGTLVVADPEKSTVFRAKSMYILGGYVHIEFAGPDDRIRAGMVAVRQPFNTTGAIEALVEKVTDKGVIFSEKFLLYPVGADGGSYRDIVTTMLQSARKVMTREATGKVSGN